MKIKRINENATSNRLPLQNMNETCVQYLITDKLVYTICKVVVVLTVSNSLKSVNTG